MQQTVFVKRVSKGSRFNQIYISKDMEKIIEVGDLVQVTLLKKHVELCYRKVKKLSDFKEYLIKNVFTALQRFDEIKTVFIVGSFLFETVDYNDIDIVLIVDKGRKESEKYIEDYLIEKFSQRFHILSFSEAKLKDLLETDPLTRAMFTSYISSKKIKLDYKRIIDEKHIKFLLMMPEDLLEINLSSKIFHDNIRRLMTIERFLKNESLDRAFISSNVKKLISMNLLNKMRNNLEINDNEMQILRKILKEKMVLIRRMIKNGKKG